MVGEANDCSILLRGCVKEYVASWVPGVTGECLNDEVGLRMGINGYSQMLLQVRMQPV